MLKRKLLKPGKSGYKITIFDAKTGETQVFVKLKATPVVKTPSPADKFKIAFNPPSDLLPLEPLDLQSPSDVVAEGYNVGNEREQNQANDMLDRADVCDIPYQDDQGDNQNWVDDFAFVHKSQITK
ncbi:hypothetical protein MIR68_011169 [Amoeboaphelidium protococcarum]|nr:hypothetical protein MIR68_011169 [Amoeboaphelidium protococcarum]